MPVPMAASGINAAQYQFSTSVPNRSRTMNAAKPVEKVLAPWDISSWFRKRRLARRINSCTVFPRAIAYTHWLDVRKSDVVLILAFSGETAVLARTHPLGTSRANDVPSGADQPYNRVYPCPCRGRIFEPAPKSSHCGR